MGKFIFEPTKLAGAVIITPTVFGDARGYFMETYQYEEFAAAGLDVTFVQDNQSSSTKGVLRGLHYQTEHAQGKLVRVVSGEVFDVAVDLRPDSETFGQWTGVTLSAENKKQFYIPAGFAHGFVVLSDTAEFVYKCTDYYAPQYEAGLMYNDPDIAIEWPISPDMEIKLSAKDQKHPTLREQFADVLAKRQK